LLRKREVERSDTSEFNRDICNVNEVQSLHTNKNGAVIEFVPLTIAFALTLPNPSLTNPNGNLVCFNFLKRFCGGPLNPLDII